MLLLAAEYFAEKLEARLIETLGQISGVVGKVMEDQIIAPDLNRRFGEQRSDCGKRGVFLDDNTPHSVLCAGNTVPGEVHAPGESGRDLLQLRKGHGIVHFVRVAAFGTRPVQFCDLGFEIQNSGGFFCASRHTSEIEDPGDISLISLPRGRDRLVVQQIIVAIRQP